LQVRVLPQAPLVNRTIRLTFLTISLLGLGVNLIALSYSLVNIGRILFE
jgi:hypothetical protein